MSTKVSPVRVSPAKTSAALRTAAVVSVQLLIVLLMVWVVLRLLGMAWSIVWPLTLALFLTTLTWPPTRFLRNRGWRPALAAALVTLLALAIAVGTVVLIVVPVASQSDQLVTGVTDGIQNAREWAAGPPLNLGDDQVTKGIDEAVTRMQGSIGSILTTALVGVSTIVNGLVTAVLAVLLMFFFLKDGPRFIPWLSAQLPGRLADDVPIVATRSWDTLGRFVRSQAFVGLLDAVCIGAGLAILGVPLVLPLAVLTFISAFVPIIGAFAAGFVSVIIALVFNGFTDAVIVLIIIIVVQQLEGNVFSPMIQSKGLGLHAAVVLLAVTLGGTLAGIVGSLLAVPVAALVAVLWGYVREQISDPAADDPVTDGPAEEGASEEPAAEPA